MIAGEELQRRVRALAGGQFPLVQGDGSGRVAAAGPAGFDLAVCGVRTRYTWERLDAAAQRLMANHALDVDELGGGPDAAGLVSLLAVVLADDAAFGAGAGQLVLARPAAQPVHQFADMSGPSRRWPRQRRVRSSG